MLICLKLENSKGGNGVYAVSGKNQITHLKGAIECLVEDGDTVGGMLPPGGWMVTVKHVFAIVLYALALWFLRTWLPGWVPPLIFGLALLLMVLAGTWVREGR